MKQKDRGRSFVFTVNLSTECTKEEGETLGAELEKALTEANTVEKFVFQLEKGERHHLQGWLYTKNKVSYKQVHALFPDDMKEWVRRAAGTPLQCWEYCTKDETKVAGPWSKGQKPDGAGKRNDLHDFVADAKLLKTGERTLKDLQEKHIAVEARYMKYYDRVVAREWPKRTVETQCTLVWGPPATGKTTWALAEASRIYGADEVYYLPLKEHKESQQWWDQYDGQKVVIIEDADTDFMGKGYFKRLIDKVPLQVQTKGGHKNFSAAHVYITANMNEEGLFPYHDMAIARRFHHIWETAYAPAHKLNTQGTNSVEAASNAIFTQLK